MEDVTNRGRYLTAQQASRVYDRIGKFQDWQSFYEGRAIQELLRLAGFESAKAVFEFGSGTGAFAVKLLRSYLPPDARYFGLDVSPKMIQISTPRLSEWSERAVVKLSDGSADLPVSDGTFDRFISNYVFDLLSPEYASRVIAEAHRILSAEGKLCLVSLGEGVSGLSRTMTRIWERIWKSSPELVGGCRPIALRHLLPPERWTLDHFTSVQAFGVPSEILVASAK